MSEKRPWHQRLWETRIEAGPAFFFFAALNWLNWVAVPHIGDAFRAQHLLTGFLWFAAAIVIFPFAGLTLVNSARRLRSERDTAKEQAG